MALKSGDRIKETTTTTGTGSVTLAGAASGYQAFSAIAADQDTVFYAIVHQSAAEWEVGIGLWTTGGVLVRSRVLASSNAGAAVNFSAGTKDVFNTHPALHGLVPPVARVLAQNAVLLGDEGVYAPGPFEISSGVALELSAGAVLEVG